MKPLKFHMVALIALTIFLPHEPLRAEPVLHKFLWWGKISEVEKLNVYIGWTNGFFQARGQRGAELADCLDENITFEQALAMIDKRYKDHPEVWSNPLGTEILNALTVKGGPCEDKNPLSTNTELGHHSEWRQNARSAHLHSAAFCHFSRNSERTL